jgi:hypothetical protein
MNDSAPSCSGAQRHQPHPPAGRLLKPAELVPVRRADVLLRMSIARAVIRRDAVLQVNASHGNGNGRVRLMPGVSFPDRAAASELVTRVGHRPAMPWLRRVDDVANVLDRGAFRAEPRPSQPLICRSNRAATLAGARPSAVYADTEAMCPRSHTISMGRRSHSGEPGAGAVPSWLLLRRGVGRAAAPGWQRDRAAGLAGVAVSGAACAPAGCRHSLQIRSDEVTDRHRTRSVATPSMYSTRSRAFNSDRRCSPARSRRRSPPAPDRRPRGMISRGTTTDSRRRQGRIPPGTGISSTSNFWARPRQRPSGGAGGVGRAAGAPAGRAASSFRFLRRPRAGVAPPRCTDGTVGIGSAFRRRPACPRLRASSGSSACGRPTRAGPARLRCRGQNARRCRCLARSGSGRGVRPSSS